MSKPNPSKLVITYSPVYLDWHLGDDHPTNPIRATLATQLLEAQLGENVSVIDPAPREKRNQDIAILHQLHDKNYVDEHLRGNNHWLWNQNRPETANAGLAMFQGTV